VEPGEAFGKALRAKRKALSLSQEQLAFEAGIERVYVSWLENGHKQPTFQTMLKLARALGCSASELVASAEELLAAD
jgi:transcriptional regulator with XRE-family HTH domain